MMRKFRFLPYQSLLVSFFIFISLSIHSARAQDIIRLEDQRQLFIDHHLIGQMDQVALQLHHPENRGPVLSFDKPWEGHFSAYCTIIKDDSLYRAYYRGVREAGKDGNTAEVTCYAQSQDGIHWEKPNLQIFEVGGTLNNNVILANAAPVTHNFSPFIDKNPNALPGQKYKAIGGTGESGLIAYVSADGIHWRKIREESVFTQGLFDSQNVAFWSEHEKQYVCYFRIWTGDGYSGYRSVGRTTSDDFITWSAPEDMTFGHTPPEHLYTQQTSPYYRAPSIYVAIGARFMPNRQVLTEDQARKLNVNPKYFMDCSDAVLMTSRGDNQYDRTFMESFIRPGIGLQNWVSRSNYPALNVVETSDTEMSVYVNENYAQPTAHLKRYALRIDGFSSLSAGYQGGKVTTRPFTFTGNELEINYSTSAAGGIRIEVQDPDGQPLPGFGFEQADEIIGNEIKRIVTWQGNSDLTALASMPVKLCIYLKDANLYSLKFNQ